MADPIPKETVPEIPDGLGTSAGEEEGTPEPCEVDQDLSLKDIVLMVDKWNEKHPENVISLVRA